MLPRLRKYVRQFLDHVMPDGPPFFLTNLILFLLIVNGFIAFLRW
jgi:hypothetical protein